MGVAASKPGEKKDSRVREWILDATDTLVVAGVESARLDARLLMASVLGGGQERVLVESEHVLADVELARLEGLLLRRRAREPMSHILGTREFWSLPFRVTADTLTPRPETETVVEAVIGQVPDRMAAFNILDLGTGTGCLLISLLHEYPRARGLGLDISAAALRVAESNAVDLNVSDRARFAKGGWGRGDWANGLGQKFDVVVSNPPYIPDGEIEDLMPEVARFEPRAALAGGVDGLDAYRNIIAGLPECMKERGMIFFEVGAGQASAVTAILMENGFKIPGNRADSAGLARCIFAACQGK